MKRRKVKGERIPKEPRFATRTLEECKSRPGELWPSVAVGGLGLADDVSHCVSGASRVFGVLDSVLLRVHEWVVFLCFFVCVFLLAFSYLFFYVCLDVRMLCPDCLTAVLSYFVFIYILETEL